MRRATQIAVLILLIAGLAMAAPGPAAANQKKAIWGPVTGFGGSQFPIYNELGAGIYEYAISWRAAAPTQPANPADPADPAYQWPAELDFAISEAQKYGMRVSVMLLYSPAWANGGRSHEWAPNDPKDFATFASAAARRYPAVDMWMVWGEPSIRTHFQPLGKRSGPRRYAAMLDASYKALKAVDRANLVIGGNTITRGDVIPLDFIRNMRLKNGKPPRMDMYGHNPFSPRRPNLKKNPVKKGTADISDLDTLLGWLDEHLHEGKRNKKLKLFISEWTVPTDHRGRLFDFWADRQTAATYLSGALRITSRMRRVYTFGWFTLYDEPPTPQGDEVNWGLITHDGIRKPAFSAFQGG